VKSIAARPRVKVSTDGHGVVSHAGVGMLRELAELTGLSAQVTAALADTYRGRWTYAPGAVFADLAAAVADAADCIDGVGQGPRSRPPALRSRARAPGAAPPRQPTARSRPQARQARRARPDTPSFPP
jgi:hypothetical protein